MTDFYFERAPRSLTLVICGGHDWDKRDRVLRLMDHLNTERAYVGAVRSPAHAGAPTDVLLWSRQVGVPVTFVPKRAKGWSGRLKVNLELLDGCSPKDAVVVLFPGKFVTTQHMYAEADRRGFQVLPVEI